MTPLEGSCNCKAVQFSVRKYRPGITACHCQQCRKQSGHHWASGFARDADVEISGEVRWYAASPSAKRGFCPVCGCFLFWKAHDEDAISFSAGALDESADLRLYRHIFVPFKGRYYDIADDLPQS